MTNNPVLQDLLLLAAVTVVGAASLFSQLFTGTFAGILGSVNRRNDHLRLILRHEASSPWYFNVW